MKRWLLTGVVLAAMAAPSARAAEPVMATEQCQPQQAGQRMPPGFGRSQYGVRVIYSGPGYQKSRYTYPGYVNGFPPPAFLYYGYPNSGFSYGTGF